MKKLFASTFAIALSIFATTANAENVERTLKIEGTNITITAVENAKTVIVSLNNNANGGMTVTLEDAFGEKFAADEVKPTAHFAKRYNLSQLETGKYRIVLTKNAVKTIQPFELTSRSVILNESERKEKFLPTISQKGKKLDVNVLLGNYSNISVKLYNSEGIKAFEDTNYVVLTLNKRYDLSQVNAGTYIVEVVAGDETQYFTITLDK
jgi:hypothetical protein